MLQEFGSLALLYSVLTLMFFPPIVFSFWVIEMIYRRLRKGV